MREEGEQGEEGEEGWSQWGGYVGMAYHRAVGRVWVGCGVVVSHKAVVVYCRAAVVVYYRVSVGFRIVEGHIVVVGYRVAVGCIIVGCRVWVLVSRWVWVMLRSRKR